MPSRLHVSPAYESLALSEWRSKRNVYAFTLALSLAHTLTWYRYTLARELAVAHSLTRYKGNAWDEMPKRQHCNVNNI